MICGASTSRSSASRFLVTVIGLKIVGLVLIVALLIIPAVAARFWTERVDRLVLIAAAIGAASGHVGAALSAAAEKLPTGPMIVLVAFAIFLAGLVFSPTRGVAAAALRARRLSRQAHRRQGLLALARGEPIYDRLTLRVLRRAGYIRQDGVATLEGRAAASRALLDEARWSLARRDAAEAGRVDAAGDDGLTMIEEVMTPDQIAALDARLARPASARGGPA